MGRAGLDEHEFLECALHGWAPRGTRFGANCRNRIIGRYDCQTTYHRPSHPRYGASATLPIPYLGFSAGQPPTPPLAGGRTARGTRKGGESVAAKKKAAKKKKK